MIILKHVICMRVLRKKNPNHINQVLQKLYQMISCELKVAKTILFDRGFSLLFAAVNDCILVMLTQPCLLVIQEPEKQCFLAFLKIKFKEVYVVPLSKISKSKSVIIFHCIFAITLSESHALSRVHNKATVCETTIF